MDWTTIIASAVTGAFTLSACMIENLHKDHAAYTTKKLEAIERYFHEAGLCMNIHRLQTPFKTATSSLIPYLNKKQAELAVRILKLMQDGDFYEVDKELVEFSIQLQKFHQRIRPETNGNRQKR